MPIFSRRQFIDPTEHGEEKGMIRVMIVDDSPLVRKVATDILTSDSEISVVTTASNAEFALRKINSAAPDVITMDIEMPGMGGIAAIREIMAHRPTPIIVLSAFAKRGAELTLHALEHGAVDFIAKPAVSLSGGINEIATELIEKVRHASTIRVKKIELELDTELEGKQLEPEEEPRKSPRREYSPGRFEIVAIGTSTGGPVALKTLLMGLPDDFPLGVVVVQHMPPVFTTAFAIRLDSLCSISVKEAEDGDPILPGHALIAPGDYHMTVSKYGERPRVLLHKWKPVSGHRPSVDVLMHSVAKEYGNHGIGVIMTGMGKDGAEGLIELKREGGYVIAQDKESSVIYGMNREVIINGDAHEVVPVNEIAQRLLSQVCIKEFV